MKNVVAKWSILRTDDRGASVIEFSIAAPFFIFMLFALLDFGYAMYIYDAMGDAAKVGARYAIVRGTTCADVSPHVTPCPAAASDIATYVQSRYPNSSGWSIQTTWRPGAGIVCPAGSASYQGPGCQVTVTISFTYHFLLLSSWSIPLSENSVMTIMQ